MYCNSFLLLVFDARTKPFNCTQFLFRSTSFITEEPSFESANTFLIKSTTMKTDKEMQRIISKMNMTKEMHIYFLLTC